MNKFTIITNPVKDPHQRVTRKIAEYLNGHKKECVILSSEEKHSQKSYHYTDVSKIPMDTDCVIVLGGDGTLLQAARDVIDRQVPLFGINLGTLGYLAEIDQHSIYPALDRLMVDLYTIENRMMLSGKVVRQGKVIAEDMALNDIVISREGAPLRVVWFNNYVNDTYLNTYKADGIIIATPTGSTGYSLSAGGPIISPSASLILMTPLAPHTLNTRSIVFSSDDVIAVELGPGRDGRVEQGVATFDGASQVSMITGDRILISKSKCDTKIIKINNISFLEVLREKMSNN